LKVRANEGAPGVDAVSVDEFERDLRNNLYRIWNRMSPGTYFPPSVCEVENPTAKVKTINYLHKIVNTPTH
jgi:RNA-directed DNA polymerase